jgi:uridine phosphorylase
MTINVDQINPFLKDLDTDNLYHLGLDTSLNLVEHFSSIRYVVFTLSHEEALIIAREFAKVWYNIKENEFQFNPIYKVERFHLYKVGPLLILSIVVGMPSLLIGLNEVTKLLFYLGKLDVIYLKLGFCGGLGADIGSIVISEEVVDGKFLPTYDSVECGRKVTYTTLVDHKLATKLYNYFTQQYSRQVILAKTLGTQDFYEGQARLTGALPLAYTQEECKLYLQKAYAANIRSIDMESLVFAAFANQLAIPFAILGVPVVNRLALKSKLISFTEQLECMTEVAHVVAKYLVNDYYGKTEG